MSAEHGYDVLLLASKVNGICAVESPEQVSEQVIADAQSVVEVLDPRLKPTRFVIEGGSRKGGSGTQKNLVTDTGHLSGIPDDKETLRKFEFGRKETIRIGLYKTIKWEEDTQTSLNFEFFMESVDTGKQIITRGPVTHLIYVTQTKLLKAITRSVPLVYPLGRLRFVTYDQESLWGVGKASWSETGIMWG